MREQGSWDRVGREHLVTLGSLKERSELWVVMPRAGWQGSHSLWRLLRSLRRRGDEAIVQKSLVIGGESARRKGEVEKPLSGLYYHISSMIQ